MFDYTKCDAVTVGRGAYGNPWFLEKPQLIAGDASPPLLPNRNFPKTCERHFGLPVKSRGEIAGTNLMRADIFLIISKAFMEHQSYGKN